MVLTEKIVLLSLCFNIITATQFWFLKTAGGTNLPVKEVKIYILLSFIWIQYIVF